MDFLQIGIAAIQSVAQAIVVQRHDLVRRHDVALARELGIGVHAEFVFVQVVAEMQHEVQVVALGDARVGVEVAVRIVRARSEGETQAIDAADGQRARAADRRLHAARLELIVVSEAGIEPGWRRL